MFVGSVTADFWIQAQRTFFFPYTPTHTFQATFVTGVHCNSLLTCSVDIYSDSGGRPDTGLSGKIGAGTMGHGGLAARFEDTHGAPVSVLLTGGQKYWLAVYAPDQPPGNYVSIDSYPGYPVDTYYNDTGGAMTGPHPGGPFAISVLCSQ